MSRRRDQKILQGHLKKSAEQIAEVARAIASRFSTRIPLATKVVVDRKGVSVQTDGVAAPNARPFEYALNHPFFGNRERWYKQPFRPYMLQARDRVMPQLEREIAAGLEEMFKDRF